MIDSNRRIRVHEGHEGGGMHKPRRKVHWRGTIAEYWGLHAHLSLAEMQQLIGDLDRDGYQNIGGGPARQAYVIRPDAR